MIGLLSLGKGRLVFPVVGHLTIVRQAGAGTEGTREISGGDWKVVRMILPLIEMDLLSAHHRIGTLTGEGGTVFEGGREVGNLFVIVKQSGREGGQTGAAGEGGAEVIDFRTVRKEIRRKGLERGAAGEGGGEVDDLRIVGEQVLRKGGQTSAAGEGFVK